MDGSRTALAATFAGVSVPLLVTPLYILPVLETTTGFELHSLYVTGVTGLGVLALFGAVAIGLDLPDRIGTTETLVGVAIGAPIATVLVTATFGAAIAPPGLGAVGNPAEMSGVAAAVGACFGAGAAIATRDWSGLASVPAALVVGVALGVTDPEGPTAALLAILGFVAFSSALFPGSGLLVYFGATVLGGAFGWSSRPRGGDAERVNGGPSSSSN